MESTGIYWKSPYAALEKVGIVAWAINARHVKNVHGRKTDVADAQWLATLARSGLLHGSFIPPAKFAALSIRKGHKKSIVALAHKMLRIVFAILKTNTPYRDRSGDYEALSVQKNASRWIKVLKKHGFLPTSETAPASSAALAA